MDVKPDLTIVIPAKNEASYIGRLLDSLLNQDYSCITSTPIFVADFNSTDRTTEIVKSYRDRLNISVIQGGLPSAGRNRGAALAQSRYVLFLDADIELPDPTIIRRTLTLAQERDLYGVTTYIKCSNGDFRDNLLFFLDNLAKFLSRLTSPYASGMFILFQKKFFDDVGGFDERVSYAEDVFLMKRVPRQRFAIVPGHILTSNRRFKKTGHWRVFWLAILTTLNRNNDSFFYKEKNYFD